jgi:hypothetical protein
MGAGHPLDSAGLVLPEASWPDRPGSAGMLEPLRRFCNTANRESGADAWRTPRELADWLAGEGYGEIGTVDPTGLARLVALREALWVGVCTGDFSSFAELSGELSVRVEADDGDVTLAPDGSGIEAVVVRLALTLCAAAASGALGRLKCCDHCRWVFHDTSKNRSGRWCSMAACGGRNKARAYRRRQGAGLAGVVGLFLGLLGCADDSSPAEGAVEVPGLTATLEQYREDEIQGLISVKTTNASSSNIEFRDLRLEWTGLTNNNAHVRATSVPPGVRYDIRVVQGDAVCGDPPDADGDPPGDAPVAIGNASIDGAAPVTVAVPVDDPREILPKVYRRSCQDQRVRWAGDLRFGDRWTPSTTPAGEPAVVGTIELERRGSEEPLTITEINGSVLLRISAVSPSEPIAVLESGQDATTVPILIEQSGNCAAHALAESKKTFIIPIGFAVGEDEPAAYLITFDDATKQLLNAMINESCGLT